MTVTEILQFADSLVFASQKKHLDDLQQEIIKGVYEGKTYQEIADQSQWSESRVRNVASQLLQLLSKELGENIEKANFRSTFNRLNISSSQNQHICHVNGSNHSFNYSPSILFDSKQYNQENEINNKYKTIFHDLTLAPKIIKFYNRETELKKLFNWIENQNISLISVLGLSGIGKSYLVRRFIDLNLSKFEIIIWENLKLTPSLNQIIKEILAKVETSEVSETSEVCQLLNLLKEKKCLIILDDVQNIFISGQFVGQYQTKYKDYQKFFTMITETNHQSNIILISQGKCAEMESLDEDLYPVKCLELSGLDDINILNGMSLNNQNNWLDLINLYEGNLMYLKTIAILINQNYDGEVADFLAENTLHITSKMQSNFRELFNHLSPIEQKIVLQLSKFNQAIDREELRQNLSLNSVDFNNGLQSLQQRYLVTKIKEDKILFKLSPVFREYVRNYCQD